MTAKKAFVFPGQGSQFVGMAAEFASSDLFKKTDELLGFSLSKIIQEGPEEELTRTSNSQPALVLASIAQFRALQVDSIEYVAGHSLGEYSALVAAESLSFEDAVKLVHKRGLLMETVAAKVDGAMLAVLGLETEKVEQLCRQLGEGVFVANYNCPGQVVLSGEKEKLTKAVEVFQQAGAKRAVMLKVSGPFHSPFMKEAAEKFAQEIAKVEFKTPKAKYISNVTADYVSDPQQIKALLIEQIYHPVRWVEVVERLCQDNVCEFEEVGPGMVLTGLIKKIKR